MAEHQGKVGEAKSGVIESLPLACASEDAAVAFLEDLRWPKTKCCPRCGSVDVYPVTDRDSGGRNSDHRWRCRDCRQFYTVRTGTVMEDSRIPLKHWCWAFWQLCSSKKGMSAKQIQRQTGLSYKSSLFLLHRVRFAMSDMGGVMLQGTVESDEVWIGGKPRKVNGVGGVATQGRSEHKVPVQTLVERGGNKVSRVLADVSAKNLRANIDALVDKTGTLMTDENKLYRKVGSEFEGGHLTVQHNVHEYARPSDGAHINTAESAHAIIKRGMYGVYHSVSKRHLHRYLAEFDFRWNHRKVEDGARTVAAIQGAEGKRLMYREPLVCPS
jgi:transposase-like protein